MLPSKNRLPRSLFDVLFKENKVVFGDYLILRFTQNKKDEISRFSIILTKKMFKTAVSRNKIKRQIYGILQKNMEKIKKPHLAVFSFKKILKIPTKKEIESDVLFLLKKSGIKVD